MLMSEATLPMPYAECKGLALVYPYETAVLWFTLQMQYGDPRHVGVGRLLTDGRWMMDCDILSELHHGGILAWAVPHLSPEIMASIELVPMSEVEPLIVPPQ